MPILGLHISNVIASGKNGMKAYNTQGMELHSVQLNVENGPAFLVLNSKDLLLDGISTLQPTPGTPVVRLDHCPNSILRGSRAFAGTGVFLSVPPGELKDIVMEGNTLDKAQMAVEEAILDFLHPLQK